LIKDLSHVFAKFDDSLVHLVILTKPAVVPDGIYWIGILIAAAASIAQYFQSKQLMPQSQDSRSLRTILKDAGQGKQADQAEVNAAVGRSTMFLVPGLVFIFAIRLALALPLYWLTSSVVAYIQQARVLREDAAEADNSVSAAKPAPAPKTIRTASGLKVTRKTLSDSPKPKSKTTSKARRANRRRRE
jgi:membrane protein insertase Oxa1/YidC/SpoIIIJ